VERGEPRSFRRLTLARILDRVDLCTDGAHRALVGKQVLELGVHPQPFSRLVLHPQVEQRHATLDFIDPRVVGGRSLVDTQVRPGLLPERHVRKLHRAERCILLWAAVGPLVEDDGLSARSEDGGCELCSVSEGRGRLEHGVLDAHNQLTVSPIASLEAVRNVRQQRHRRGDGGTMPAVVHGQQPHRFEGDARRHWAHVGDRRQLET